MTEYITKTVRLGVVLLAGATLAIAGSLTQPCKAPRAKVQTPLAKADRLDVYCEEGVGRSDAGLKGGDAGATWNQSGSIFAVKYSAILTNASAPPVEPPSGDLQGKPPAPVSPLPVGN